MLPPRQTSQLTSLDAHRRAEKPGRNPLAREPPGTPGTGAQAPVQRVGLLRALPRPAGLRPRPGAVPACPRPRGAWPGRAWGSLSGGPRGSGGVGVNSESGGGGRGSPRAVRPEARSSLAGFLLRKMSAAEAPPSFGDEAPRAFLPLPRHSEICQEPRQRPGAAAHGPDPAPAPLALTGQFGRRGRREAAPASAAFFAGVPFPSAGYYPDRGPATVSFAPWGGWRGKMPRSAPRGKEASQPTPKRRQLGRSAGPPPGSAPPSSSTRDFHAAAPACPPAPPPPRLPGFPATADKGRTRVKIMEGSGKEKAVGTGGRPVAGTAAGPSRLCLPFSAARRPREPAGAQRK